MAEMMMRRNDFNFHNSMTTKDLKKQKAGVSMHQKKLIKQNTGSSITPLLQHSMSFS